MLLTATLLLPLTASPAATALATPQPAPAQDVGTAKESESKHRYPVTIKSTLSEEAVKKEGAKPQDLALLGLAIREKYFIKVNVYSYVVYADSTFVAKDLAAWKGKSAKALGKDATLYKKLLSPNGTKELRMRFCRDVDAEDIVEAFEDSLEPRILSRRKAMEGSKAEKLKDLTTFRGFFSLDELKEGNELRFTWHPDGTLCTVVNGERKPDLKSQDLAWAMFDVYLGDDPISKSGKKDLVSRLPGLLAD
jgi:ATP-dependent RNA helicase DHX36